MRIVVCRNCEKSFLGHGLAKYCSDCVKRQYLRKRTPRNFVANLLKDGLSNEDILEKVDAAILKDEDYRHAVALYYIAGERRNLTIARRQPSPADQREEAAAKSAELRAQVEQIAKPRIVQFVLLEMVMPNGKTLAECTFKEVAAFGAKFAALSKGGKPNEKVGNLSEPEVRKLFR
jgi:hypothetical protein